MLDFLVTADFRFHFRLPFFGRGLFLCLALVQHVREKRCRQMLFETVPVLGDPHPLPLLWCDASGLRLPVVNGGSAEYRPVLCLEHGHSLYAVQVNAFICRVEQVHF